MTYPKHMVHMEYHGKGLIYIQKEYLIAIKWHRIIRVGGHCVDLIVPWVSLLCELNQNKEL